MAAKDSITRPPTQNILQPNKFQVIFNRLPNITFFCQEVNLPGISIEDIQITNPFTDFYVPSDKAKFDHWEMNFLMDENLNGWIELYTWIIGIAWPENVQQSRNFVNEQRSLAGGALRPKAKYAPAYYSDAILTINNNANVPAFRVTFRNCFPISVPPVRLSTKSSADETIVAECAFRYDFYNIERI